MKPKWNFKPEKSTQYFILKYTLDATDNHNKD